MSTVVYELKPSESIDKSSLATVIVYRRQDSNWYIVIFSSIYGSLVHFERYNLFMCHIKVIQPQAQSTYEVRIIKCRIKHELNTLSSPSE